ncbi:MAG: PAS domain-containing protein [Candidatus Yanofskybacteria bacterium]|nr:PAS domain-containing protein [Candidatus Yanofskybacteria bacterium]
MSKKTIISASDDNALKLKVLAEKKEGVRRKLVVTAKRKEGVRGKLAVIAKQLAATAKEKESIRKKLAVTAEELRLKAKQLAVTAREKEDVRAKNEAMLASIRDGLIIVDLAQKITFINKAAQDLLGWKNSEIIGKSLDDILPIEDENGVSMSEKTRPMSIALASGITMEKRKGRAAPQTEITSGIYYYLRKDKTKFPVAIKFAPVMLASKIVGAVEVFQDISDQKLIEEDLKNARIAARNVLEDLQAEKEGLAVINAKDEALLESIGDGVIATNQGGEVVVMNKAAENLLGFSSAEIIGKLLVRAISLQDMQDNQISDELNPITLALTKGKTTTTTTTTNYNLVRKNGTKFPVAITATPVILEERAAGAIVVFRDITKEKELDHSKSEFISIASHQLRTPLTGIQWVVERFTKKEELTPKGREYLNDIHASAKRLTELVDLMLSLSRIESGKIGITPEPLEVIAFVNGYFEETAPLRDKKELNLIFEDHPAELSVMTDKSALRNIVQSVISNAIEYTPNKGKVEVAIQKKNDTFVIKVGDTGIGIPQSQQAHIFEKFVRADNAKLYKTDGTGIGLYIANRAANLLGGKIWFESEENKGSTFYVELPLEFRPKEEIGD